MMTGGIQLSDGRAVHRLLDDGQWVGDVLVERSGSTTTILYAARGARLTGIGANDDADAAFATALAHFARACSASVLTETLAAIVRMQERRAA